MVLPKPCTIDNFYRCCIVINLSDCAARKGSCKRPTHAVDKACSGDYESRLCVCVSRLNSCSSVWIRACSFYDLGSYRAHLKLSRDFIHILTISAECLLTDFKIYAKRLTGSSQFKPPFTCWTSGGRSVLTAPVTVHPQNCFWFSAANSRQDGGSSEQGPCSLSNIHLTAVFCNREIFSYWADRLIYRFTCIRDQGCLKSGLTSAHVTPSTRSTVITIGLRVSNKF